MAHESYDRISWSEEDHDQVSGAMNYAATADSITLNIHAKRIFAEAEAGVSNEGLTREEMYAKSASLQSMASFALLQEHMGKRPPAEG